MLVLWNEDKTVKKDTDEDVKMPDVNQQVPPGQGPQPFDADDEEMRQGPAAPPPFDPEENDEHAGTSWRSA